MFDRIVDLNEKVLLNARAMPSNVVCSFSKPVGRVKSVLKVSLPYYSPLAFFWFVYYTTCL